ncbi:MAG: Protoporphyrinogen oxidase [Chlamydiae bacterium]|nr:Protoporphyrinogen oxidase [Chlamydiota bacterium]
MKKIVILGGGISGLSAAWFAKKKWGREASITLLEGRPRVGGWIETCQKEEFLFEKGPRGFRPKGNGKQTLALVESLGLQSEIVSCNENEKKRYISRKGKLVPFSPLFLLKQGILSAGLRDLFASRATSSDESIASFFTRRFNQKITSQIIDPLVKGVFGGNAEELSIRSCFPTLWEYEKRHGSVVKGLLKKMKTSPSPSAPLLTFKTGMARLPEALAEQIEGEIHLSTPITKIERDKKGFCINEKWEADLLISALPTYVLAPLLAIENPFSYTSLSMVSLGWRKKWLKHRGYGFLVPSSEKGEILGMTWDSEIFPAHNRGPQTRVCVIMTGSHPDATLFSRALQSVEDYLHHKTSPDLYAISSAYQAIPQYHVGHHEKLSSFRKTLPANLLAIGSAFEGVGVNDCIALAHKTLTSQNCENAIV